MHTVTWYSTSIVPFLTAVWKKHSNLPAGSRNVNSLSRFCPKQLTEPKQNPNTTAKTNSRPLLPSFFRRRFMLKIFSNTGLSKFSHLLRIPLPQQNFAMLWLDGGSRTNHRRKSSNLPPITATVWPLLWGGDLLLMYCIIPIRTPGLPGYRKSILMVDNDLKISLRN